MSNPQVKGYKMWVGRKRDTTGLDLMDLQADNADMNKKEEKMRFYRLEGDTRGGLCSVYSGKATVVETRQDTPEARRELTTADGFPIDGWIWSF